MSDQKNTILAIVLSALVLIGWQIYFGVPQMEKQKQQQAQERSQPPPAPQQPSGATQQQTGAPAAPGTTPQAPGQPTAAPAQALTREAALAASPRVRIETPSLAGSIALKGGRIDDLSLIKYRETVDPNSPPIVLLAPSGSPHPFYAEFGWSPPSGVSVKLPGSDTLWRQQGIGRALRRPAGDARLRQRRRARVPAHHRGRRQIPVHLKDEVVNKGAAPVTLYPYGLISRHGTPQTLGYYILHEGLIGVFGDKGLQEETYANIEKQKSISFTATNVWLGITDKYWAATLLPDTNTRVDAKFSTGTIGNNIKTYQSDYLGPAQTIAPGATAAVDGRLFAGAKEVGVVDNYDQRAQAQPLRAADRLGLLLLHHQAAVPGDGLDLSPRRQFRRRHPDRHRHHQVLLLPARQQVLRLDGEDEGGAAGDDGDPRALRRRQDEAAAGDDGALQEGEDQSDRRLPADPHPDPGLLRALQGAVRHHRDAARAVLRLDQGPLRARSDHGLQPVRAHSRGIPRTSRCSDRS